MGEIGAVGTWDQALFERFRAAKKGRRRPVGKPPDPAGAERRRLLGEVIRINTPLVIALVHQVQGNAPPERNRGRVRTAMHLVGARDIEWDVALNLGRFACAKAAETFDAVKGSFSGYLLKKVFYELQCEVGRQNLIRVDRGARPVPVDYLEDDEHLGRLHLDEEPDDDELPQIARLEELEERTGAPLVVVPLLPPHVEVEKGEPIIDLRLALDVFLDDVCVFAPAGRTALCVVIGRSHAIASSHGEYEVPGALATALRAHGVRATTMRVPWWETPVRGLAGVRLHSSPVQTSSA